MRREKFFNMFRGHRRYFLSRHKKFSSALKTLFDVGRPANTEPCGFYELFIALECSEFHRIEWPNIQAFCGKRIGASGTKYCLEHGDAEAAGALYTQTFLGDVLRLVEERTEELVNVIE